MPATKKKQKCLTCNNKAYARGLCYRCYSAARGKLQRGEATEEELVERGLMLAKQKIGRQAESGFAKAFAKK